MTAYYNEHDPFAAAWLRQLIASGRIAPGDVDERSIEDVTPDELTKYTQYHFFAGVGGWSYALRLAGWPDDRPVWTGSCPCQPFSAAGKRGGVADERHLWPAFFHLINELHPATVFGEQVSSRDGLAWFDLVQSDLEGAGYAATAYDLCAAGFGAPHIRQRLYFVAYAGGDEREQFAGKRARPGETKSRGASGEFERRGNVGVVADTSSVRREQQRGAAATTVQGQRAERSGEHPEPGDTGQLSGRPKGLHGSSELGNPLSTRLEGHTGHDGGAGGRQDPRRSVAAADVSGALADASGELVPQPGREPGERNGAEPASPDDTLTLRPANGFWRDADWIACRDGKWRAVEPGTFPLAHGAPARVGRLRDYGNAIVPQVAASFIKAFMTL